MDGVIVRSKETADDHTDTEQSLPTDEANLSSMYFIYSFAHCSNIASRHAMLSQSSDYMLCSTISSSLTSPLHKHFPQTRPDHSSRSHYQIFPLQNSSNRKEKGTTATRHHVVHHQTPPLLPQRPTLIRVCINTIPHLRSLPPKTRRRRILCRNRPQPTHHT